MRPLSQLSMIVVLCTATILGCDRDDPTADGAAATAGERIADAAEQAGEALAEGAERTGEVVGKAVDELPGRTERAAEAIASGARELAADETDGIRVVLAEAVEAALTPRGIDDVIERFAEADRQRIGDVDEGAFAQLDDEIEQFRRRWSDKYGKPFDVEEDETLLEMATVQGDPAGGDRAVVIFPARQGMPELHVPMVREMGAWFIDAPNSATSTTLGHNLLSGLKPITAGNPPLPDEPTEAYRSTVHGTLAALMGEQRRAGD